MKKSETALGHAYRFFRRQYIPACTALAMAKAELAAGEDGLSFSWEYDEEGARDWYCQCGCKPEEVLGCVCYDEDGEVLASLWAIGDPDMDYRRVVEAELALEAGR